MNMIEAILADEFMCGGERLSFDTEKFQALDQFLDKLKGSEDNVSFDEDKIEEAQLSFLEHCDSVLLKMAIKELEERGLSTIHDIELKETLLAHLELAPVEQVEGEELPPLSLMIDECFETLEEIEDVAESWLLVATFNPKRIEELYKELKRLKRSKKDSVGEALRAVFYDLMHSSPMLEGKQLAYFHLVVEHLNYEGLVLFIQRFLQAQLEYGRHLQEMYLSEHPEFLKKVSKRFKREATIMANRCIK